MTLSLRAYRVNKEMTIEQVARKLDVSPNTVRNWEKGRTVPKRLYIDALAKLYGIDVSQIFLKKN